MTKADIVEIIHQKIGLPKPECAAIVETLIATIKDTLVEGHDVKIPGFGTFSVRSKKSRRGRNPQTGEPVEITARRVLSFKASKMMNEAVDKARID